MAIWKLNDIYDFNETEKLIEQAKNLSQVILSKKNILNENISNEDFLLLINDVENLVDVESRLGGYAQLWLSENTGDSKRAAHYSQISQTLTDIGNQTLFFNIWFKNLSDETAVRLINADQKHSYMLSILRKLKKYALTESEEKLINLKDLTGIHSIVNIYDIITNKFTWEYEGKTLSQEEMIKFYQDFDGKKREEAYSLVLNKYGAEEAVLGEIYKSIVIDWKNENVSVRKFDNPISVRNIGNDIPDEAVENLLSALRENKHLFQDYLRLKFKLLKIDSPKRTDVYAPRDDVKTEYDYESGKNIVLETYKQFSEQMFDKARLIFEKEHVHSDISKGKRSGAFCATIQNDVIPYILINYTNRLKDVFTLMHETGHGIHGILGSEKNNKFNFEATLPLAETASIFGETLLYRRMIKESDDVKKISLLMDELDGQYASICRQAYFTIFEKDAHELIKNGAGIDELNLLYMNNLKEQFDGVLEIQDFYKHEWKYIPHIYHSPFYCYAYSFGNLLVLSLLKKYDEDPSSFVPKFIKILEYGGSKSPYDVLIEAGFDITKKDFWNSGFDIIRSEIEELKRLIELNH